MSRLIVFGSRGWVWQADLDKCLDKVRHRLLELGDPVELVITGGAIGADRFGYGWAVRQRIPNQVFVAEWEKYGKQAGFIRNGRMLAQGKPTHGVGFWVNHSAGTADMKRRLVAANIPLWMIERTCAPAKQAI